MAGELDVVNLESDIPLIAQQEHRDGIHHTEDSYYSLLEENMFLLDQLKDKEEICSHLQNELERLDDKTEKTNRTHQEEIGIFFIIIFKTNFYFIISEIYKKKIL